MSRGGHQEPQLAERRLRPIYDLLDCGSNKKALQEVEKVLKKWPRLQCARALKCLAMLRLGRERESLQQLQELVDEVPTDDSALLVMTIVYRETYRLDRVCNMYEAAIKKDPSNEELHTQLFMSYVRVANLEKQQQSAMALYKLKLKNPYYFWAVMSIVLQATKGVGKTDSAKSRVLLTLAQRMVDKFIDENKLEAEQEVELYLMILKLQDKNEEALEFLKSALGQKLLPGALPQASLPLLVKLKKWNQLNVLCKELIWDNPDRWDFYQLYFQSAFKLIEISNNDQNADDNVNNKDYCKNGILDCADDSPIKCHQFLMSIIENLNLKVKYIRGPYLARLEFYKCLLKENKDPEGLLGDVIDLLVDYFKLFGHKACSVNDLRPYLFLVEKSKLEVLAQKFVDTVGTSAISLPQSDEQMQRHICSVQLGRICGRQAVLAEEHARILANTLALHCERAALCPPRSPTERAPYDPYSLLAAHLCYDLALKCKNSKPLVEALCLLEYVLQNSPSNFHCKLLCIKFYHMLGCGGGAHSIYELLDVKHVQLDSLGHIHVAYLGATGLFNLAFSVYEMTHSFFSLSYKDSVDHLTFSYKFGSFVKLEELMEWRERLHSSLHRATVLTEKTMLSIVNASSHAGAIRALSQASLTSPENVVSWDALRDNRDLGVFVNWDPLDMENENTFSKQFLYDSRYANIKYLLLKCLVSCSIIGASGSDKSDNEFQLELAKLNDLMSEFDKMCYEIVEENFEPLCKISVTSPLPSRILALFDPQISYRETYKSIFSLVTMYARNEFSLMLKMAEECGAHLDSNLQYVCDTLDKQIDSKDQLWICRATLEVLVNFIEVISVMIVVVGICSDLVKQSNSKKNRKKISVALSSTECGPTESVTFLTNCLHSAITTLSNKLDLWCTPHVPKDLSDHFSDLSVVIGDTKVVMEKLKDSHQKSITSIKQILKEKQKYLSTV